jgi:hypothetical protein
MLGAAIVATIQKQFMKKNDLDEIYQGCLALLLCLFKFFDFSA